MARSLASSGYVLTAGTTALEGPAADLKTDPRMADLYLGQEAAEIAEAAVEAHAP